MNTTSFAIHDNGITLRQAALTAGVGLLIVILASDFAESFVYPKLVVPQNIEATVRNIAANKGLFVALLFAYVITFIGDLLIAWALYVLLIPVNRSLSLLTAWFRLVYMVTSFVGFLKLVSVYRIVNTSDYATVFGADQLHAQVQVLLNSFRYEWSTALVLFGIHLVLLGYLVYRSRYIPSILGVLLAIAGVGWLVSELGPYLSPRASLGFVGITFLVEPIFMLWLLVRGWKIQEEST